MGVLAISLRNEILRKTYLTEANIKVHFRGIKL